MAWQRKFFKNSESLYIYTLGMHYTLRNYTFLKKRFQPMYQGRYYTIEIPTVYTLFHYFLKRSD